MINKIKISAMVVLLGLSSASIATTEGWYVGAAVGYTNTDNSEKTLTAVNNTSVVTIGPIKPSNTGGGGRLFTGYSFNHFAAVEFGFNHYGASNYSIPASAGVVGSDPEVHINVVDILGRVSAPFFNTGFALFAKGGMAIARVSKSKSLYPPTADQIASCQSTSGSAYALCPGSGSPSTTVRPEIGVGASYDFTPNWQMELAYMTILKNGVMPNTTFAYIGFSYHWVDLYCGQFLC